VWGLRNGDERRYRGGGEEVREGERSEKRREEWEIIKVRTVASSGTS